MRLQTKALREYARKHNWKVAVEINEVASGSSTRARREELLRAARRCEVDVIVFWRLDRWGRLLADLDKTLNELGELDVGFVSLNEALHLIDASKQSDGGNARRHSLLRARDHPRKSQSRHRQCTR